MASQEDKIKKLEEELDSMETVLTTFGNLFNADGNIDDNEQQQLDNMSRMIRKIRIKITTLKKAKKTTDKKEEIPKKFRLGLNKLHQYTESMQIYLAKAGQEQDINSKHWNKMVQKAERAIFKLRKLYSNTSDTIFEECNALIAHEEAKISTLKQEADSLETRITAAKKAEEKLDGNMKALLKQYKCPRELYKKLEQTMAKVETDFNQFIAANL
mgnify:CR=1 FL=1